MSETTVAAGTRPWQDLQVACCDCSLCSVMVMYSLRSVAKGYIPFSLSTTQPNALQRGSKCLAPYKSRLLRIGFPDAFSCFGATANHREASS